MLQAEIAFLVEAVCPESPDADACGPRMTEFWGAVGPVFWPEYSSHICDDREDCAAKNLLPKVRKRKSFDISKVSFNHIRQLFLPVSLVCPESMVLLMLWSGRTPWCR